MKTKTIQSRYLNVEWLAERYQVSKATIWRWTQNNNFPKPIRLNGSTRWQLADVELWEESQK